MSEKNHYALFGAPSVENLEANQRGRLTSSQQSALAAAVKGQRDTILLWAIMISSVLGIFGFIFWNFGSQARIANPQNLLIGFCPVAVLLVFFVFYLVGDVSVLFSSGEIKEGRVEAIIGKVEWSGGRYKFVSESRKLSSMRFGRTLPPPGDYRLYCLPRSGLVVTAEELSLASAPPKDLLLEALAKANHFTMSDLEVNRTGSLSGRQEIRLFEHVSFWIVLLAAFLFVSIFIIQRQAMGENSSLVYPFLAIMAVIVFVRVGWRSISLIWDIWGAKVEYMDGRVTRQIRLARNTRYYTYQLNGIKFNVSLSAYNALIEGNEYRVYFTPRAKRLVAIEPLT